MSIGREINSFFKWLTVFLIFNAGLLCLVGIQIVRVNHCDEHLAKTLLYPGVLLTGAGAIGLFFAAIGSLVGWISRRREIARLRQELVRLEALKATYERQTTA